MTPTLVELVTARNFPAALKILDLDVSASQEDGPVLSNLLCNRAYCFQQLDLQRKALKVQSEQLSRLYDQTSLDIKPDSFRRGCKGAEALERATVFAIPRGFLQGIPALVIDS